MRIIVPLLVRLAGASALLWWYSTGSRLAGVIMFALIIVGVELLSLTTEVLNDKTHSWKR